MLPQVEKGVLIEGPGGLRLPPPPPRSPNHFATPRNPQDLVSWNPIRTPTPDLAHHKRYPVPPFQIQDTAPPPPLFRLPP